jgi:hypothetical protein
MLMRGLLDSVHEVKEVGQKSEKKRMEERANDPKTRVPKTGTRGARRGMAQSSKTERVGHPHYLNFTRDWAGSFIQTYFEHDGSFWAAVQLLGA